MPEEGKEITAEKFVLNCVRAVFKTQPFLTYEDLGKRCGLSASYLNLLFSGHITDLRMEVLERITAALDYSVNNLLQKSVWGDRLID